jgi:hypothetical protein
VTFDSGRRFSVAIVGTYRISQLADDHVALGARAPDGVEPLLADLFGEQVYSCC